MDLKRFLYLLCCATLAKAQYSTCDLLKSLTFPGQSITVNHLASDGSCRYLIVSPVDTYVEATCTISTICSRHVFTFSRAGLADVSDGLTYCGSGNPPVATSIGNEMVVTLNNGGYAPGSFTCTFTAVTTNCDCGWSVNTKIVGGSNTGVNEIVSHAGLVNTATKEIYCGAIIGENISYIQQQLT
jgi:hypothetical protein